jgi:hypothetical protein
LRRRLERVRAHEVAPGTPCRPRRSSAGPAHRGRPAPIGPCAVGPSAPNQLSGPLSSRHAPRTHGSAAPTTPPAQRRRHHTLRTHAAMPFPCCGRVDDLTLREPPCSAAYKRAGTSLARRHPGCCQRRAPMPARSPCHLAFQASPLGIVEGPAAACCLGLSAGSPEHPPPRPPPPDFAAHALWSSSRRV